MFITIEPDWSPEKIIEVCGLDWEVKKSLNYFAPSEKLQNETKDGPLTESKSYTLYFDDGPNKGLQIFGTASESWEPIQNLEFLTMCSQALKEQDLQIAEVGMVKVGQSSRWLVVKAKTNYRYNLKDLTTIKVDDVIDNYIILINKHQKDASISVFGQQLRLVCQNGRLVLSPTGQKSKITHAMHNKGALLQSNIAKQASYLKNEQRLDCRLIDTPLTKEEAIEICVTEFANPRMKDRVIAFVKAHFDNTDLYDYERVTAFGLKQILTGKGMFQSLREQESQTASIQRCLEAAMRRRQQDSPVIQSVSLV